MKSQLGRERARAGTADDEAPADVGRAAWARLVEATEVEYEEREQICAQLDLLPSQAWALRYLDPARPMPMNVLAAAYRCDASNITGIVDKLEAKGLVERRPSEEDRRVKMLAVTPTGARVRARLVERLQTPPPWLSELSPAELHKLETILARALANRAKGDAG